MAERDATTVVIPEVKRVNEEIKFKTAREKTKANFINLANNKLSELDNIAVRIKLAKDPNFDKTKYENHLNKYKSLLSTLKNGNKPVYKIDLPREIQNSTQAQEYFRLYGTKDTDPTQQYFTQNPDYYLSDYEKKQKENEAWRKKAYDNWYNADPLASQAAISLSYGVAAAPMLLCLPEVAAGVGLTTVVGGGIRSTFAVSTEMAGLKAGMSWSAQALINGPREVNYVAVAGDAFFVTPFTGSVIGSVVDVRLASDIQTFYLTGYNKSLTSTAIDATSAFVFGKAGSYSWGKLGPLMMNGKERYFMYFSTQMWNYTGGYGAAKMYNNKYENSFIEIKK